ncbi:MAG: HEAT repeat domain-containing protein [Thermoleophilia bacterium]|nr:HEAT repeat domain-containing protein [Thermoleophilia bacterium]
MEPSSALIGLLAVDTNLVITHWDSDLESAYGMSAAEACGRVLTDLVPDVEPAVVAALRETLTLGTIQVLALPAHGFMCSPPRASDPQTTVGLARQELTIFPVGKEDITGAAIVIRNLVEESGLTARRVLHPLEDQQVGSLLQENRVASFLDTIETEHPDPAALGSAVSALATTDIDVVPLLLERLKDPRPEVRMHAAMVLAEREDPRAVPDLIEALEDSDANVRYHVIEALGRLRATEAVEPLSEIAATDDFYLSFVALEALRNIGSPAAFESMTKLLDSDLFREEALEVLAEVGSAEAVIPIVALLENAPDSTSLVARALVRLWERYENTWGEGEQVRSLVAQSVSPAAKERLITALQTEETAELAEAIAVVLTWLQDSEADQALADFIGRGKATPTVISRLSRTGGRLLSLIRDQVRHENEEVRRAAVVALGRLGDTGGVETLLTVLTSDPALAAVAADSLAKIGDRSAFEGLYSQIGHADADVREAVIGAINSLGHPETEERVRASLEDANPVVRESAVRIAGYFGFTTLVPLLLARTEDPEDFVRAAAVEHLPFQDAVLTEEQIIDCLLKAFADPSPLVRAAATRASAHIEAPRISQQLAELLKDPDMWVRYYACRSLERKRDPSFTALLLSAAQSDPAPPVRAAALDALTREGVAASLEVIVALANSPETDVQAAAIRALGRSAAPAAEKELHRLVDRGEKRSRVTAINALAGFPSLKTTALLTNLAATEEDEDITDAALQTLARLGSSESVWALLALSVDPVLRRKVVQALVSLTPRSAPGLSVGVHHPHSAARLTAVEALLRMKHPETTKQALAGLADSDAVVRLGTLRLSELLGSAVEQTILEKLQKFDPDPRVRAAARRLVHT